MNQPSCSIPVPPRTFGRSRADCPCLPERCAGRRPPAFPANSPVIDAVPQGDRLLVLLDGRYTGILETSPEDAFRYWGRRAEKLQARKGWFSGRSHEISLARLHTRNGLQDGVTIYNYRFRERQWRPKN